jgi:uncharacterized membrane protein YbhN (UPF0104 family)
MNFKRWAPWITLAVSIVIVALLVRTLRRYDFAEVYETLRGVSAPRLGLAIACVAGSYLSLTLFDTLAVRYVGRKLPYWKTALASFTGLSIGHNVGLAALSSGAVRYRFYSRWGLSAQDVGKLIVFCAMTVGLGLLTLGGLAWTIRPDLAAGITGLPLPVVYVIGGFALAASVGWIVLAFLFRRPLRIRHWRVEMPAPHLAAAQLLVGTMNFAFVAAALHQAILTAAEASYLEVAAAYVIGNSAAIASHVPGGLGVIEAVIMYLLPQADLLAAVLLFRAVYYLLPLPLGALCFLGAELYYRGRGRAEPRSRPSREPLGTSAAPARR